ncbi:MAG: helix-turn-helix transcriptional regulator [Bacteroidales bacterium]|nr:helix-turn-helix transcriptional regulator [Bacteroidales bacterium]
MKNTTKDLEIFVDLYADLVVRINQLLREKNITKLKLAEKLDKKPSEISKWLSGEHNFTLRSLAKISAELGEPLLEVPKREAKIEFIEDGFMCRIHTFISYKKIDTKTTTMVWQMAEETESYNELNNAG